MKNIVAAGAFILSFVGQSLAADLPQGQPYYPPPQAPAVYNPAPAPAFSWTGFYVGLYGGYDAVSISPFDGGIVGGQFGYNYQFGSAVAGVEVDGGYAFVKGTINTGGQCDAAVININNTVCAANNYTIQSDILATARVRGGWVVWNSVLTYGTVGIAAEHVKQSSVTTSCGLLPLGPSCTPYPPAGTDGMEYGWVAGAGVEWAFTNNMSVKAEYLYGYVSTPSVSSTYFGGTNSVYVVKLGLNYLFH